VEDKIQSLIKSTVIPTSSETAGTSPKSVRLIHGFAHTAHISAREDYGLAESTNIWRRKLNIYGLSDEISEDINPHHLRIGNHSDSIGIEIPEKLSGVTPLDIWLSSTIKAMFHTIDRLAIGFVNGQALPNSQNGFTNRRSQDVHDLLSHEQERAETLNLPQTGYTHYISKKIHSYDTYEYREFTVVEITFSPTAYGATQSIALLPGSYNIECYGAQGGTGIGGRGSVIQGGRGAYVTGILDVVHPMVIHVYVGGHGANFNCSHYNCSAGCGGGASDIRLNPGPWDDITSLRSRIMVAAGGGAGSSWHNENPANTAKAGYHNGGALVALNSTFSRDGRGATQTAGGAKGTSDAHNSQPGGFGFGGHNANSNYNPGIGGGGWYGGGCGGADANDDGNGGGGSSYISGHLGCNSIDAGGSHVNHPYHISGIYFTETGMTAGMRLGNGLVRITRLGT